MKIGNNLAINTSKTPSFSGALSQKLLKGGALRKFSDAIEYDSFGMSSVSVMALLYFAVIGFRVKNAYDKYDRYEILRRDVTSLTALIFLADMLKKGFSQIGAKATGLVLTQKPKNFDKLGTKIWNYINPTAEFRPLSGGQIVSKYSQIDKFKDGMADFCRFIREKGGNLKKVLKLDSTVKTNAEEILGKTIDAANDKEIIDTFSKTKNSKALKAIYQVFEKSDNAFVKKAKMMNNLFGFISVFLLTPALMVWIAKSNEKITKQKVAKDLSTQQKTEESPVDKNITT